MDKVIMKQGEKVLATLNGVSGCLNAGAKIGSLKRLNVIVFRLPMFALRQPETVLPCHMAVKMFFQPRLDNKQHPAEQPIHQAHFNVNGQKVVRQIGVLLSNAE